MISLIQLEYVTAVDTHRHFGKAAGAVFVTQPTLSMQILKMEKELDTLIFDRSKKPVVPTEAGVLIIDQARQVLREAAKIEQLAAGMKGKEKGELKIGIIPSLAPYALPRFAGNVSKKYPELNLMVIEMLTEQLIEALKKDRIDAGILVTPISDPSVKSLPLFYESIQVYANEDHALLDQPDVALMDLTLYDAWVLSQGHCFRNQVINLCSARKDNRKKGPFSYEGGSLETLRKLVDAEGGFTLMPELAVRELPQPLQKRIRPIRDLKPLREVSLVYTRSFAKKRLLDLLMAEIRSAIPDEMLDKSRGTVVEWE